MKKTVMVTGLVASIAAGVAAARAEGSNSFNWRQPMAAAAAPAAPETTGSIAPAGVRETKARVSARTSALTEPQQSTAGQRGPYRDLIARHASANGVPFALADAVVRIESRYNPGVRHGGAVGLMQIKPQTARGLGYRGDAAGLMHPETNLRWGMLYLAQAYRLSRGDTCATVMRYQSGHGATRMSGANRVYCSKARTIMASLH